MNYDDLVDAIKENTQELKNLQKIMPYHLREIKKTETLRRVKEERAKQDARLDSAVQKIWDKNNKV